MQLLPIAPPDPHVAHSSSNFTVQAGLGPRSLRTHSTCPSNGLPDSAGKLALLGGDGFLCPRRGCTATGLRGRREEAAQEPQRPTGAAWATTAETQSAQAPRRPACKLTAQRGSLGPCKHLHPRSTPGGVNIFKIAEELANLKDSFHNSQEKFSQAKKLQRLIHLTKKKNK